MVPFAKTVTMYLFPFPRNLKTFTQTIGISVEVKRMIYKGKKYEINIWDTAGQERYRAIISRHYKEKHGIILTIDLSEPNFEGLDYWLNQIEMNAPKDMPVVLVGTKKDLKEDVNLDSLKAFALEKELPFIATSAKTNDCVDLAFETLLCEVLFRDVNLLPKMKGRECNHRLERKAGCC